MLVVDGNNVMGSRPDGWWKDRAGAARRLVEQIGAWATDDVLVYFDGAPVADMPSPEHVEVRFATRRGRDAADDDIAALVASHPEPASLLVVTSDAELAGRVREHGARVEGARRLLDRLGQ
ncbi:MAG TPA: NYN domain-containing protein [Solirubrobacteraceae bacterium]|nr:NYN domain-containing protein [Solirubrobacteraceae bacterium]